MHHHRGSSPMPDEVRKPIKGEGFQPSIGGFSLIYVGEDSYSRDLVQDRLTGFDAMYEALSKPQTADNILDGFDAHQLKKIEDFIRSFDGGYVRAIKAQI